FSSRRRHTRSDRDWSSDVCSSDLALKPVGREAFRDQPGEDLALHGDGSAWLDEVEHPRLEHVAPGIHQMARGLAPRRFLDEPRRSEERRCRERVEIEVVAAVVKEK